MEGVSTACLSLARHDDILPRGSLLPPPSILLSALITPPSICVHLPLLLNSRHPHHNRSLSYSLAFWTRRRRLCFGGGFFVSFFSSSSLPPMDAYLELLLSHSSCSPSSLPPTSLPPPAPLLCWLAMYFSNMLPLSTTQTSAMEPPLLAISC